MSSSRPQSPHNPPVTHDRVELPVSIPGNMLIATLAEHLHLDRATIETALIEGGIHLAGKRLVTTIIPKFITEKTVIDVYRFLEPLHDLILDPSSILYEDKTILAVNKPAWLPTQGTRASLRFSLEEKVRALTGIPTLMAAHRLDRQTSGVVLFGKTSQSTSALMKAFSDRTTEKIYLAIVSPLPAELHWQVSGYLMRDFAKLPQDRFRLIKKARPTAKWSESHFRLLEQKDDLALVECRPITGRTHQLRVHLAASKTPIVGDTLYGNYRIAKAHGYCRIQLHAYSLSLPYQHQTLTLTAPIPDDFIWSDLNALALSSS